MKIGIITWFRHENFGTALQAVALQSYLRKNKDNSVSLIDYEYPTPNNAKPSTNNCDIYSLRGKIIKKIDSYIHKNDRETKSAKFKGFISKNCNVTKKVSNEKEYASICNEFDTLVFGSDQIWNPNWFHDYYYANYDAITSARVSYAPSFGLSNVDKYYASKIKDALNKFSRISVREKTGVDIVYKITGKKPQLVVDPTLLLTKEEWEKYESQINHDDKYVLCYMLTDNKKHWRAIRKFGKKYKLDIVVLPHDGHSLIQSRYVIRNAGPDDFLKLIHNAEYIITDSYHAFIFSLIYNKKFIIFERHDPKLSGSENSRIYDLLDLLNIRDRITSYNSTVINTKDICSIEYENALSGIINESKQYIDKSLKGVAKDGRK